MKHPAKKVTFVIFKYAIIIILIFIASTFLVIAGAIFVFSSSLPSTEDLRENYNPPQTNRFYAIDGTLIGETFLERRTIIPISSVPRHVINAILAAEDADFFKHEGLDYVAVMRAIFVNIISGHAKQGASTITQQVARTFYLGREKTFKRKIKELLLARRIEQNLSKEEILFLYLNQICWGHGRYGLQEAARYYFGKDATELDIAEAALLAGLPKGPEIYSPFKNPQKAKERRNWVLDQMVKHGFLSEKEALLARDANLPEKPHNVYDEHIGAEFIDAANRLLIELVGKEKVSEGGYQVWTTMVPKLQKAAVEAVRMGLKQIDRRHNLIAPYGYKKTKSGFLPQNCPGYQQAEILGEKEKPVSGKIYEGEVYSIDEKENKVLVKVGSQQGIIVIDNENRYNPSGVKSNFFARPHCNLRVAFTEFRDKFAGNSLPLLKLEMGPQAALIAIDVASSRISAMVGGYNYHYGEFNRAFMARRQPGSAFKTFVYLTGLKNRKITPATLLEDAPLVYEDYQPQNYEAWHFEGKVRLRKAFAQSINLVAIRVAEIAGVGEIVKLAKLLGIESPLESNLALALGASGVTPREIANAYATIARGGIRRSLQFVTRIIGPDGKEIPLPVLPPPERVITQQEAFIITNMLESVVREGTGSEALGLKRPCAGKTGTSNKARDAWFVGFIPSLTAAVWVGYDDYKPLGKNETGAKSALPIWLQFMKLAVQDTPVERFGLPPEGIVVKEIDPATGLLAYEGQQDSITEVFLEGTEPTEKAPTPSQEQKVPVETNQQASQPLQETVLDDDSLSD